MSQQIVTIVILISGGATIAAMIPPAVAWFRRYRHQPNRAYPSSFGLQHLTHIAMVIHHGLVILILFGMRPLSFFPYSTVRNYMDSSAATLVAVGGLMLFVAGNVLRVWAAYAMGDTFDKAVLVKKDHSIKTEGPYRLSRHPMYTGNLLAELGLGLAVMSWPLVAFTFLISFPLNNHRAATEEELLEAHFGRDYRQYRKRVGRWLR